MSEKLTKKRIWSVIYHEVMAALEPHESLLRRLNRIVIPPTAQRRP